MKKTFRLRELDCAHCADKMVCGIKKIPGVQNADINFMAQRLVLEADDARFDEVLREAAAVCRRIEPDCEIIK